jgi:hypothetical protein
VLSFRDSSVLTNALQRQRLALSCKHEECLGHETITSTIRIFKRELTKNISEREYEGDIYCTSNSCNGVCRCERFRRQKGKREIKDGASIPNSNFQTPFQRRIEKSFNLFDEWGASQMAGHSKYSELHAEFDNKEQFEILFANFIPIFRLNPRGKNNQLVVHLKLAKNG